MSETTVFVYSSGKLIAEYSTATPVQDPTTKWTVTDQLGSPRILVNSLGEVVSRRDFMPFGEELFPDGAHRTANLKYTYGDNIRQKFTGYQKDNETGLDFAEARMYQNFHGRFTAVDPLLASGKSTNPQTFNRYVYVLNNPLIYTDPTGLQVAEDPEEYEPITSQTTAFGSFSEAFEYYRSRGSEAVQRFFTSIAQGVRYYANSSGQSDDLNIPTAPPVRQFRGLVNPVTEPSITAFNNNMNNFNQEVIQSIPLLSNLVNAQMAAHNGNNVEAVTEMGMFGVDLGTTVFTGGTGGTLRKSVQESTESALTRLPQFASNQSAFTHYAKHVKGLFSRMDRLRFQGKGLICRCSVHNDNMSQQLRSFFYPLVITSSLNRARMEM